MSSLNVRFAQTTSRTTDLLNCTNLPDSDSVKNPEPTSVSRGRGEGHGGVTKE